MAKRCIQKLLGVMDMVLILIVLMISWAYSYVKTYQIIHLKYVQFIICPLCLNLKENIVHDIQPQGFHSLSLSWPEE